MKRTLILLLSIAAVACGREAKNTSNVQAAVITAVANDSRICDKNFTFQTKDGVVTPKGHVASQEALDALRADIEGVAGVKRAELSNVDVISTLCAGNSFLPDQSRAVAKTREAIQQEEQNKQQAGGTDPGE